MTEKEEGWVHLASTQTMEVDTQINDEFVNSNINQPTVNKNQNISFG